MFHPVTLLVRYTIVDVSSLLSCYINWTCHTKKSLSWHISDENFSASSSWSGRIFPLFRFLLSLSLIYVVSRYLQLIQVALSRPYGIWQFIEVLEAVNYWPLRSSSDEAGHGRSVLRTLDPYGNITYIHNLCTSNYKFGSTNLHRQKQIFVKSKEYVKYLKGNK